MSFRLKVAGLLVVAACAAGSTCALLWLLRDPEPLVRAQRSAMATVREGPLIADGAHEEQDVTVVASSGLRATLRLRRPAGVTTDGRLPVFIILGGLRRGGESVSYVRETGPRIIVAVSYPYAGNRRAKGPALVREVPAIRRALFDTPATAMLAVDYVLSRPDVDSSRVELVGASFGAPFGAMTAALDPRVSRLWLVQGGAAPYALLNANLRAELPFGPVRAAVAGAATLLCSGPRFDPARWVARVAPRPIVMINTTDDERIPRRTSEALFNAAREPKSIVWLPGRHMRPGRTDVLESLIEAVFERDDPRPR